MGALGLQMNALRGSELPNGWTLDTSVDVEGFATGIVSRLSANCMVESKLLKVVSRIQAESNLFGLLRRWLNPLYPISLLVV